MIGDKDNLRHEEGRQTHMEDLPDTSALLALHVGMDSATRLNAGNNYTK